MSKTMDFGQDDGKTPPPPPEDSMDLPIEVTYQEDGLWHKLLVNRRFLKNIMNTFEPTIEDRKITAICLVEMEGSECNMRYIYDFTVRQWRFE